MKKDRWLIYGAGLLRSVGVSLTGVVVAIYWSVTGLNSAQIGVLISLGLAGGTLATLLVSLFADIFGRKLSLIALSLLSVLGGLALAFNPSFVTLCLFTFLGMVNGMGRDRMAAFSLEQAVLASVPRVHERTQAFAWYNVVLDSGHALGSLLGGLPFLLRHTLGVGDVASYQATFLFYSFLLLTSGLLYFGLSKEIEIQRGSKQKFSKASLKKIRRFAGISFLDSLGGGFLTGALISYWFFKRFGVTEEVIGVVFFLARMANAVSFLVAAWLAKKIGLLNTMVFTHIPASLVLMTLPFVPTFSIAVGLYLIRECLVEMDVPTRQSYLSSIVDTHERTLALGMLNVTRNLGWAVSPAFAGYAMKVLSYSTPLLVGPAIKIFYDGLMYGTFRKIRPQEQN